MEDRIHELAGVFDVAIWGDAVMSNQMHFADHPPPHIRVEYQGHDALVALADGAVIEGSLPRRALALVRQRCIDHQPELVGNWDRAQALLSLIRIPAADND